MFQEVWKYVIPALDHRTPRMGELEKEDPSKEDSPETSIDLSRRRPESRTSSERHQPHFEEISLDSPDFREDKTQSVNSEDCLNNNVEMAVLKSGKGKYVVNKDPATDEDKDENSVPTSVPFIKLFRFATVQEIILIVIGVIAAITGGCSMPVMIILFGQLADTFVSQARNSSSLAGCLDRNGDFHFSLPTCHFDATNFTTDKDIFYTEISKFGTGAAIIGVVNLLCSYLFVTCLNHAAEAQVFRIRNLFLRAVLRQDIGWYDVTQTGDFAARMSDDLTKLQEGIGEKIGMFIFFMTIFSASLINAFIHGWELTLVIFSAMPILIIAVSICARAVSVFSAKEQNIYGKAGAIAEEVLSSIRTVVAFGGEEKEIDRYDSRLVLAKRSDKWK